MTGRSPEASRQQGRADSPDGNDSVSSAPGGAGPGVLASMLLIVVSLGVGLALAEVGVRVYTSLSDSWITAGLRADPYDVLVEPFGTIGYRPRAHRTFRYANGTASTMNAQGFRGPEVAVPKPEGVIRIVLLGGSTTHGWGVDDHQAVDRYLHELLRQRFPEREFDVVNMGFDGYDSYQVLERLEHDALELEPDFVVVNSGINDVRNARFPDLQDPDPRTILWWSVMRRLRDEEARGGPRPWTRLKHHLFMARLPGVLRQGGSAAPAADSTHAPFPDALDAYERNLDRIAELVRRHDAVLLLSTQPSSLRTKYDPDDTSHRDYWIWDAETTQEYRDSLDGRRRGAVERARSNDWPVLPVTTPDLGPELFLDDAHLTGEGNRRLAEAFFAALEPVLNTRDDSTASAATTHNPHAPSR